VAGRYQPLADDVTIAGDIRPNPSSAVDSEDKAKQAFEAQLGFAFCEAGRRGRGDPSCSFRRKSSGFARDFRPISLPLPVCAS
jgi:hypothetical protein